MFPVYILSKGNVSGLYGNKTCLKIWNSAAVGFFFWYLYFHMLNDLNICVGLTNALSFLRMNRNMVLKCVSSLACAQTNVLQRKWNPVCKASVTVISCVMVARTRTSLVGVRNVCFISRLLFFFFFLISHGFLRLLPV